MCVYCSVQTAKTLVQRTAFPYTVSAARVVTVSFIQNSYKYAKLLSGFRILKKNGYILTNVLNVAENQTNISCLAPIMTT